MTEEEKRREAARRGKIQKEKRRRRLIWKRRIVIAGMMLVLALIIFVISAIRSCHQEAVETQARIRKEKEEKEERKKAEAKAKEKEEHTLHMVAVGDHFYHDTVIFDGQKDSGEWNYDTIYEPVKEDRSRGSGCSKPGDTDCKYSRGDEWISNVWDAAGGWAGFGESRI